jgi:hypothetical protein
MRPYNNQFHEHHPPINEMLEAHRQELYKKVRERRRESEYGKRYPEKEGWEERKHGDIRLTFENVSEHIKRHGVRVRTKVEWLVPWEEKDGYFDDNTGEWVWFDLPKVKENQRVPEDPLLAITVEPVRGHHFPMSRYRTPGEPFHCSLAMFWELGPEIYDRGNIMEHLLRTFHNQEHVLILDPAEEIVSNMWLDPHKDPIATNHWVKEAKSRGYMARRPWHISL